MWPKKFQVRTTGDKSQVTVMGCVSAVGQVDTALHIIFDAASLNADWTDSEVLGTMYGLSLKGWIDTELF